MAEDITRKVIQQAQEDLRGVGPEVAAAPRQSWWEAAKDYFIDRVAPEVGDMLMQKMAQGSAEISHFLNQGNAAYTPYGYAQKPLQPLEVEGPEQSYQDMLREAAQRAVPEQDRQLER